MILLNDGIVLHTENDCKNYLGVLCTENDCKNYLCSVHRKYDQNELSHCHIYWRKQRNNGLRKKRKEINKITSG